MSIADVLAIIAGLTLLGIAFPALLFLITLIYPQLVERTKEQIETHPTTNLILGFGLFVLSFIATLFFLNVPGPGKLLGLIIFLTVLSTVMIGLAALVNQLANKYEDFSKSQKSVKSFLYSAAFLEFAILVPFIGWFVVIPITFCLTLGASARTLLTRKIKSSFSANNNSIPAQENNISPSNFYSVN